MGQEISIPTVAVIDGVKIQFYPDEHPPPHFHAVFAEFVAQIRIELAAVLKGSLPPQKLPAILAWTLKNRGALMDTWNVLAAGQKPERLK
jgi:hypothetical protein